jgi:predicted dehydrogenase
MADQIRWGILSTANIGAKRVIPAIQQSSNGVVAAVASRDLARAQAFADELDIPQAYGSYEELIAADDIDAIYNPLPNSLHAEWSIRCAEAGKPTLCEKPLASDANEAQRMVDAFAGRNVLFAEAFMYRFHPQTQRVKQMVADGAVGTMQVIDAAFSFRVGNEDNVRLSGPLAGGALRDVGCYCVNTMRFMTGDEPESVAADAQFGRVSGVDETLAGTLRFPSGVIGHFDCSLRTFREHRYEIRGTTGRILVEEAFVLTDEKPSTIKWWHEDAYEEIEIAPANHYTLMVEDFADALLNNRPPKFAPQDAVSNMYVIDRLLAVARNR